MAEAAPDSKEAQTAAAPSPSSSPAGSPTKAAAGAAAKDEAEAGVRADLAAVVSAWRQLEASWDVEVASLVQLPPVRQPLPPATAARSAAVVAEVEAVRRLARDLRAASSAGAASPDAGWDVAALRRCAAEAAAVAERLLAEWVDGRATRAAAAAARRQLRAVAATLRHALACLGVAAAAAAAAGGGCAAAEAGRLAAWLLAPGDDAAQAGAAAEVFARCRIPPAPASAADADAGVVYNGLLLCYAHPLGHRVARDGVGTPAPALEEIFEQTFVPTAAWVRRMVAEGATPRTAPSPPPARFAIVSLGAGYHGVVFESTVMVEAFLRRVCPAHPLLRSAAPSEQLLAWRPCDGDGAGCALDVFVRLATTGDRLAVYPLAHSDFGAAAAADALSSASVSPSPQGDGSPAPSPTPPPPEGVDEVVTFKAPVRYCSVSSVAEAACEAEVEGGGEAEEDASVRSAKRLRRHGSFS